MVDMTVDESPKGGKIMATQLTDLQKTAEKWIGIEERLSERKREADSRGSLLGESYSMQPMTCTHALDRQNPIQKEGSTHRVSSSSSYPWSLA